MKDPDLAVELARRAGSTMNVQKAYADGHSLDDIAAEIDKRMGKAPVVPRETPFEPEVHKPMFSPLDLSKMKPATTIPGAVATGVGGALGQVVNAPGAVLEGARSAYVQPLSALWKRALKGAGAVKTGIGALTGQKIFEQYPHQSASAPGETLLPIGYAPQEEVSPELQGPGKVGGALQIPAGLFEALGLNDMQKAAGKAQELQAPPVPETPYAGLNAAAAAPAVLGSSITELLADPTLLYGLGKGGLNAGKDLSALLREKIGTREAPKVDTAALLESLGKEPDKGLAAELRAKITGESGPNPELPGSGYEPPAPEGPNGTPVTDWDQAAIARGDLVPGGEGGAAWVPKEGSANVPKEKPPIKEDPRSVEQKVQEAATQAPTEKVKAVDADLAHNVDAAEAVSKKGKPKLSELTEEKAKVDQQDMLDQLAQQSRDVQEMTGLKYADHVSLLDYANPQTSQVIGPAAEQLNRAFEELTQEIPKYLKMRNAAVDLLKKQNKVGMWVRDMDAERRVAKALDGKLSRAELLPKETDAYNISRAALDKVARLEGLDMEGRTLTDYWFRQLGKDHPLVKSMADKGYLYDPFSGNMVKPSTPAFHLMRGEEGPMPTEFNYDLGDVLGQRLSIGVRKAIMDPIVHDIKQKAKTLAPDVQDYLNGVLDRVQGRPGKVEVILDRAAKGLADTAAGLVPTKLGAFNIPLAKKLETFLAEKGLPGASRKAQQMVARAYYRYFLGAALDTSVKNLFQSMNTVGVSGVRNTAKGAAEHMKTLWSPEARKAFADTGTTADMIAMDDKLLETFGHQNLMRKWDSLLYSPMEAAEYINRGIAYRAGMAEAAAAFAKKGVKNPPLWMLDRYAKNVVDLSQFKYGPANINPYLNNPLGKLYYQFATYPAGQMNLYRQLFKKGVQDGDKMIGIGGVKMPVKLWKMLALQGMVGVGLKQGLDIDVRETLGMGDLGGRLPFQVPGAGTLQDVAGRIFPFGKNPLSGEKDLQSPAMQAAGAASGNEQTQAIKAALLGTLGVPGRTIEKAVKLSQETQTGEVKNNQGETAYEITPAESWRKFFGLKPEVQRAYIEAVKKNNGR